MPVLAMRTALALPTLLLLAGSASVARAHISVASGPAEAGRSAIIRLGVGHGCTDVNGDHADTQKIRVTIPTGLTNVRALRSDFGPPTVVRNAGVVTAIEWTKPDTELLAGDDAFYEIAFRAAVPNTPFTQLPIHVEQTCKTLATGVITVANWNQAPGSPNEAPVLTIAPQRQTPIGWTKLTLATTVSKDTLARYFGNARIVWRGTAAYSSNSNTAALIAATPGVTLLDADLAVGEELWIKY